MGSKGKPGKEDASAGEAAGSQGARAVADPDWRRRRALQLLVAGSGVGVAALLAGPLASYLGPRRPRPEESVTTFAAADLAPGEGKRLVVAGRPAVVVRTDEGFRAVSTVCTHLGCIVKWKAARRQYFCPCHGGRFSAEGEVLGGPAPRPLARLEVEEREGVVVVRSA